MQLPSIRWISALVGLFAAAAAPLAQAQVGLATQYRLVSTSAPSELRVDTGFLNSATALVNSNTNSGSLSGSFTSSSINVSTDYGNMSITGSGTAKNSAERGAFAWIDTPVGGAPISMYQDVLHVTSSTLAAGTDVSLQFTETFKVSFDGHDPLGPWGFGSPHFEDIVHLSDAQGTGRWDVTLNSTGTATYTLQTKVGNTLNLRGELHAYDFANANTLNPLVTADFSFSASGPMSITALTQGVDVVAQSGSTYSASVPDSGSTAGLLGLALVGVVALRRKFARA